MRSRLETLFGVGRALSGLLLALAALLVLPASLGLAVGEFGESGWQGLGFGFGGPVVICLVLGIAGRVGFRRRGGEVREVGAMLVCGLGWVLLSALGALPFVFVLDVSYLDAYFETVSGFTTTGITMLSGLDSMPRSILLWRSLTQWVGGLGILSFFTFLTRGNAHHFMVAAESHRTRAPRPVPGLTNTLRWMWIIYSGITVLIGLGLLLGGMSAFDALCHALTCISTGGYSTHDASIAYYGQAGVGRPWLIEWVIIFGMLAGGTSFLLHFRLLQGQFSGFWDRSETRIWFGLIACAVVFLSAERVTRGVYGEFGTEIRTELFTVLAIGTTTGFGTADIASPYFGPSAQVLFMVLMCIGGCVGSTGGGFKVLRAVILMKLFGQQLLVVLRPRGARTQVRLDGGLLDDAEVSRVAGLGFAWLVLLAVGGAVTAWLDGHAPFASLSGMFSAVNNIGPCYLSVEQMGDLHPVTKMTYIVGMLAGRLEIIPFALLFSPAAWRS